MRSVGFFLAVFLSVLSVFLVSTGELKRWFTSEDESGYRIGVGFSSSEDATHENIVKFDFYNVEVGRRAFTIWAEFNQSDFQVETQIDKIPQLSLRNGRIEIPVGDGLTPDGAAGQAGLGEGVVRRVLLTFENAIYKRGRSGEKPTNDFEVLLTRGKGTTDDGTQLVFEELLFTNLPSTAEERDKDRAAGKEKDVGAFVLRSAKPVVIQGPAFEMRSPTGFDGEVASGGVKSFRFQPPVSAVFDPEHPSFQKLSPVGLGGEEAGSGASDGAAEVAAAGGTSDKTSDRTSEKSVGAQPVEVTRTDAPADSAIDPPLGKSKSKLAIACKGPLTFLLPDKRKETGAPGPSSTQIRFSKDVVLYSVPPDTTAASLGEPKGHRFECQSFEIDVDTKDQRFQPERAVATWAGGRVKATVEADGSASSYVLDADRLEWNLLAAGRSEAVMTGSPTLRGRNEVFVSERAVFDVEAGRVLLESVKGEITNLAALVKGNQAARTQPLEGATPPRLDPWEAPVADSGGPPEGEPGAKDAKGPVAKLPEAWDLKADRVEFFFVKGASGDVGSSSRLSRIIATSVAPEGVEIRSKLPSIPKGSAEGAESIPPGANEANPPLPVAISTNPPVEPMRITAKSLSYFAEDSKVTLEGTDKVKPRLSRGEEGIESQRIHVLPRENIVWFDGAVRARVENLGDLNRLGALSGKTEASPGTDAASSDSGSSESVAFDLEGQSLTLRRMPDGRGLRDVWGRGDATSPLRLTAVSNPWFRFAAPEFYWDQEKQLAQLRGSWPSAAPSSGASASGASAAPGAPDSTAPPAVTSDPESSVSRSALRDARVEFENGILSADRIQFDRARWRAYLSDRVLVRLASRDSDPEAEALEISTAKAEVDFHPGLEERGPPAEGQFRYLRRIKSIRATRDASRHIEIQAAGFVGRAESLAWESSTRELRFFGNGFQEIELLREDFHGPCKAREIVFNESKSLITCRGDVQGNLVQAARPQNLTQAGTAAQVEPASHASEGRRLESPLVWAFETNLLEAQLRIDQGATSPRVSLVNLKAKDKVLLRNDTLGLQLRGDDLTYDAGTRKVKIYSPEGRPQTLLCDPAEVAKGEEKPGTQTPPKESPAPGVAPVADKVHKIVAQEIWLLLYENAQAVARGEPKEWLLVDFSRDVMASFYLPPGGGIPQVQGAADTWKLVAEKLTLHVDPSQDPSKTRASARRLIPWAVASGKVLFSSGNYQATAERAIYEDPWSRITLIGTPARVSKDNKTLLESPEIEVRKSGSQIDCSPLGRQSRPSVPVAPAN